MERIIVLHVSRHQCYCNHAHCWENLVRRVHSVPSLNVLTKYLNRWIGRQIDDAHTRSATRYRRVLLLIIESGAIYSSAVLIEIILYFLPHNAFYIVYDPIAQLVVSQKCFRPTDCSRALIAFVFLLVNRPDNDYYSDYPWPNFK